MHARLGDASWIGELDLFSSICQCGVVNEYHVDFTLCFCAELSFLARYSLDGSGRSGMGIQADHPRKGERDAGLPASCMACARIAGIRPRDIDSSCQRFKIIRLIST